MDFRSRNYSSSNQHQDGFSRRATVAGSSYLSNSGGTPSAGFSRPSYSYRRASSGAGNSYYRPRAQERHQLKQPPPQQDIYGRREEERFGSPSLYRNFGDPASAAPIPGVQLATPAKAVNPFDQYGSFLDESVPSHARKLGYHKTSYDSLDSAPSMVESETSEHDEQCSTEEGNSCSECFCNNQGEHEQRTMGTNWHHHAPQQHCSTVTAAPVSYRQPPSLPRYQQPQQQWQQEQWQQRQQEQQHQQQQRRALEKPPPHNTPVPTASSTAPRGARLRENNFSFKLLEISPGEHMRLRGTCVRACCTIHNERAHGPTLITHFSLTHSLLSRSCCVSGARETWHAIEQDFFMPCGCMCCADTIFCIQDANYVLCPDCKVISPLERDGKDGGVGLGFKMEDLAKWQNQITRTHQRSHSNIW